MTEPLRLLAAEIHACRRCDRLVAYLDDAREKRPDYWARPVAGYGDPRARLFLLGLAPGYHGANRHGRVFTGDDSGRWLWGALHELGLCAQENSVDGRHPLELRGVWVSNAVRCAPPGNRPTGAEFDACREYLRREMACFPDTRVVVALGKLAHDTYLKLLGERLAAYPFAHGALHRPPGPLLLDSYHPSRQNTNTGRLTREMWLEGLRRARDLAGQP